MRHIGFEDGSLEGEAPFDLVLTSPPYFDLEIYRDEPSASATSAPAASEPPMQSITKHGSSLEAWLQGWYFPMLAKAWAALRPDGGHLAIYINDHAGKDKDKDIIKAKVEDIDVCVPMLRYAGSGALPDCRWVGVLGIGGETGKTRPLWLWRKGPLDAARPAPLLYRLLNA